MPIRSGELDRRITLRRPTTTTNEYGETAETFADDGTVWAKVTPTDGGESLEQSDKHSNLGRVLVEIRFRSGLSSKYRFVFDGSEYDIENIDEIGRREGLRLLAKVRGAISGKP